MVKAASVVKRCAREGKLLSCYNYCMGQLRLGFFLGTLLVIFSFLPHDAFAKKDFRGLFGSYKREKFVENEGNDTDFGFDLNLSTFLPITSVVSSIEDRNTSAFTGLPTSTYFNIEGNIFFTLDYHWEIFFGTGWCNYETRKQHVSSTSTQPRFYQFEMEMFPLVAGVKYRMTLEDIVPYAGLGGGMSYVRRKGFFDYVNNVSDEQYNFALTVQALAGLQFYIASRVGIRLEVAATYLALPSRNYDASPGSASIPILQYQDNNILFRYASGLFVLF